MKSRLLIAFTLVVSLWFTGLWSIVIFVQGLGDGRFMLYEYNKTINLIEMIILPILLVLGTIGLVLAFRRGSPDRRG